MGFESAHLARMLQDLAAVLARAREARSRRLFADSSRMLGEAWKKVFGLDRRFLQMMQPAQVAAVVAAPRKIQGLLELLLEEAELLRMQGDVESAAATAQWAVRIADASKMEPDAALRGLLMRLRGVAAHSG